MSYSSIILIEELSQAGGSTMRTITLVGPSLPLMGASWKGRQQLVTSWNPGNSTEGTQQVLGPQEMPSDWAGDWRRTMMGSCPTSYVDDQGNVESIADPSILRDALEGLFRDGRRLRVTWATTQQDDDTATPTYPITGSIVREGRAAAWEFKHRTLHDIEWSVTFDWVSRGATAPRVASARDSSLATASTPYVAALQNLVSAAQAPGQQLLEPDALTLGNLEAVSPGPLGQLSATGVAVAALQVDLGSIATIGASLPTQPIQVQQMALAHAANALATSDAVYEQYSAIPAETMSANVDAVSVLRAYGLFGPVADAAMQSEIQSYAFYQKMRSTLPTQTWSLQGRGSNASKPDAKTILGVHVVHDGDTPGGISMRWYRTPDHASDILRANGMSWYTPTLPSGKQLVIPVISSTTRSV